MTGRPVVTPGRPTPAALELLNTGVPGLNEILGGGLPALSFNLIAGGPGSGKTTLSLQILFATATPARPGLFITLVGETSLKLLRYQQLFGFFDSARIGSDIHILNLGEDALEDDLERLLLRIIAEVDRLHPRVVVVDSFGSLMRIQGSSTPTREIERFVQRLAMHLTTWEVTSFLIGEYPEAEPRDPVFTIADGILWMTQEANRNSVVRQIQVVKARGMALQPGLHTLRMTLAGVQVFPRIPASAGSPQPRGSKRLSSGIPALDEMMGGGIPAGDSVVLAGPTGAGKTTFAMRFVSAGLDAGEAVVVAIFEEHPDAYLRRDKSERDLADAMSQNKLRLIYLRPLDLSVDETFDEIRAAVRQIGATRVVIDSISGFEMALAPAFRMDFRESLYRLIGALTELGVTIFSTVEVVPGREGRGLQLTGYQVSFLTDDILSQRYVEIEGVLHKALMVVKMRGSDHSREFRLYELTGNEVQINEALYDYDDIMTGTPKRRIRLLPPAHPGLTQQEVLVFETILRSGPVSLDAIANRAGLPATEIDPILDRLTHLDYVSRTDAGYQAEARSRGR